MTPDEIPAEWLDAFLDHPYGQSVSVEYGEPVVDFRGLLAAAYEVIERFRPEATAPAYGWGESVTWNNGRLFIPLNRDGQTVADLEMGEAEARLLADMLTDATGPEPELGYDYGEAVNAPLSESTIAALNKQLGSGNYPRRKVRPIRITENGTAG